MPRIRLDIAYDGTGFNGWAIQPGQRTVQGLLESTLATILRAPARLVVAGRTDAGVHASGQVAHVDIEEDRLAYLSRRKQPIPALVATKINGIAGLKADLVVKRSTIAPDGFDARFSPLWRRYQYRIADEHAERDPLRRVNTLWFPAVLDIAAMQRAAQELLGLHDWAAYCRPRQGATTIRDLLDFSWQRDATGVLIARAEGGCVLPQHGPRARGGDRERRARASCRATGCWPSGSGGALERVQDDAGPRPHAGRGRLPAR